MFSAAQRPSHQSAATSFVQRNDQNWQPSYPTPLARAERPRHHELNPQLSPLRHGLPGKPVIAIRDPQLENAPGAHRTGRVC
jgi:hypothetical protein